VERGEFSSLSRLIPLRASPPRRRLTGLHICLVFEQAYAAIYDDPQDSFAISEELSLPLETDATAGQLDDFMDADDLLEDEDSLEDVSSEEQETLSVAPTASSSKRKRR